jgi:hypothetical protein
MGVQGDVESIGKAAFPRAAIGPILTGGQLTIAGMKLTTGLGDPEDGARFGEGGARLHGTAATLMSAQSTEDWSGTGASAYSVENVKQMTRSRAMAAADHEVHGVLATEAYQIGFHRDRLDDSYDWLADVGVVTSALGLIPGVGRGLKAAADAQAVCVAVRRSSRELELLSAEVEANAAALQRLVERYEDVEQPAKASETGPDRDPPPHTEQRQEVEPRDVAPDAEPQPAKQPQCEHTQGSPGQFVGRPAMAGPAPAPAAPTPSAAVVQAPAPPARSAAGAPPLGAMPSAPMGAGAAPMAPAPGIPIGLIKDAVLAALKEDAERQAAEDEEAEEDADGDGKPGDAKDHEVAGPGGNDMSQLAPPIAVTVDSENLIGPPRVPGA